MLVSVCTPGAPPPAAACSHGNPHAGHKQGPEKVLELSLHSRMQTASGIPAHGITPNPLLPVCVCQGHRGTLPFKVE